MKSIKNKTIQGYNAKRLASFIDRAMLRDESPKWRVDTANGKIYKFDRVHGGFLFYVTIADHNIDTLRDIAHGVNLGLIVNESIAINKANGTTKAEVAMVKAKNRDTTRCVMCDSRIPYPTALHGHNPYPLYDKGFACRTCNLEYVLPKRLESL